MKKLQVFVSSRTQELHDERVAVKDALEKLDFGTFVFENDSGARTEPPEMVYQQEVKESHIYVLILREQHSKATEDEYRIALADNKEIFVYVNDYNITKRESDLSKFIEELKPKHAIEFFDNVLELQKKVTHDITKLLVRSFIEQKEGKLSKISTLNDPLIIKYYIEKVTPKDPNSLKDLNPVAGEIMSVWNIMGYDIHNCIFNNDAIDFEATINYWAGTTKVFVRCVNGEISTNDVIETQKHIENHDEEKGFIFTHSRMSPTAIEFVKQYPRIRLQTQSQFYRSILKPEKYFEELSKNYDKSEISKFYVNLKCFKKSNIADEVTFVKEQLGDLDSYVNKWLVDRSPRHLALLGEFGSGKTWFSRKFAKTCLDRYLENPDSNRLPVFISLRDYAKSYSIKQLITDLLVNEYEFQLQGGFEMFEELNNQGKFILIFDGFDEMAQKVDYSVVADNFREIGKVASPASKVLLTCRTTYFRYEIESQRILGGKEKTASTLPTAQSGFEIIQIEELDDEQILEVMSKRIGDHSIASEYWEKLKPIYDIPSLAHKPVLIPMLIEIMPSIVLGDNSIDASMIYHMYTDKWLNQAHKEGRTYLKNKWQSLFFVNSLAWYMLKTQELRIHWKKIPEFINKYFNIDLSEVDYYASDLRTNSFLKRDERGIFEFSHKSMTEFFVAYKFALELGAMKSRYKHDIPEDETKQKSINDLSNSFGAIILTPEIILFLKDMISQRIVLRNLFNTCKEVGSESLGFLLSNLITLLVVLKEPFDSENISQANMPNADLDGAILTKCVFDGGNLSHSSMDKGNFNGSTFKSCNLSECSFVRTDFHEISAENSNLTNCNGRHANISSSDLSGSNLSNSQFQRAKFIYCNLEKITARSSDFEDADFTDSALSSALFDNCNFDNAILTNVSFKNSQLTNSTFHGSEMTDTEFSNVNLRNSKLDNQNIERKRFGSSNLENTSLIGVKLRGSKFSNANLNNSNLIRADLSECKFEQTGLIGANLSEADLNEVIFIKCNLSDVDLHRIRVKQISIDEDTTTKGVKIDLKTFQNIPSNLQQIIIRDNDEYSDWAF